MASRIEAAASSNERSMIQVWDPVVRLFHWSLVAAFATAWFAEEGEMLHEGAGYVVLALLAIRLVWGVIGTRYARFADFVRSPGTVTRYLIDILGGHPRRYLGHNPAGGAMVLALIGMCALAAGSGWLMTTDAFWGTKWVEALHEISANATLAFIALHVLGVLLTSWQHKENLVGAMITGRKRAD